MEDFSKQQLDQSLAVIQLCKDLLEHKKRDTKLLFAALIVSLMVNVITVAAFLWYESTWDYSGGTVTNTTTTTTETEQTVDGEGDIVNGDQYNDQSQNNSGGE